jgi:hypothetical protein
MGKKSPRIIYDVNNYIDSLESYLEQVELLDYGTSGSRELLD